MLMNLAGLAHYSYHFEPVPVLWPLRNVIHMMNTRDLKTDFQVTFVPLTGISISISISMLQGYTHR